MLAHNEKEIEWQKNISIFMTKIIIIMNIFICISSDWVGLELSFFSSLFLALSITHGSWHTILRTSVRQTTELHGVCTHCRKFLTILGDAITVLVYCVLLPTKTTTKKNYICKNSNVIENI